MEENPYIESGDFYSVPSPGRGERFTVEEDACLLYFIERCPYPKGGEILYQIAENYKILDRPYQSMRNRYKTTLKRILDGIMEKPQVDFDKPYFKTVRVEWKKDRANIKKRSREERDRNRGVKERSHSKDKEEKMDNSQLAKDILNSMMVETGLPKLKCAVILAKHGLNLRKALDSYYTDRTL